MSRDLFDFFRPDNPRGFHGIMTCSFGGGGGGSSAPAAPARVTPPAAPAPQNASSPTQTVTQILSSRAPRHGRASTILSNPDGYSATTSTTGRRTILGVPIA